MTTRVVSVHELPEQIAGSASIPFMLASIGLAAAYGSSFFLVDTLRAAGKEPATAGAVISTGTAATILCSLIAGRIAERTGTMQAIIAAAAAMAAAMACFAASGMSTAFAYVGGILLGIGWSAFYILAPLQVLRHVQTRARIKYLTFLSGSQMLGIGLAAPLARWIADATGSYAAVYIAFAAGCTAGALLLVVAQRSLNAAPLTDLPMFSLTIERSLQTLRKETRYPIVMIGVGACIFAGLSTFQSLYAASRGLSPDVFFLVFTATAVILRFAAAPMIGHIPLKSLAGLLSLSVLVGLLLLYINNGSTSLYMAATAIFALGYGLSYSTLNSMVVNIASIQEVSLPVSSQIFTLSYFIGLFGFPFVSGSIVRRAGFDTLLIVMMGLVVVNLCLLALQVVEARTAKARVVV